MAAANWSTTWRKSIASADGASFTRRYKLFSDSMVTWSELLSSMPELSFWLVVSGATFPPIGREINLERAGGQNVRWAAEPPTSSLACGDRCEASRRSGVLGRRGLGGRRSRDAVVELDVHAVEVADEDLADRRAGHLDGAVAMPRLLEPSDDVVVVVDGEGEVIERRLRGRQLGLGQLHQMDHRAVAGIEPGAAEAGKVRPKALGKAQHVPEEGFRLIQA